VEQVLVLDLGLRPVFQVEGEEHRALDGRRVIGRRLLETQLAVELHGDAHGRQGVQHHLAVAQALGGLDGRQGQLAADAVAAHSGST
jgi:hypothetical protein